MKNNEMADFIQWVNYIFQKSDFGKDHPKTRQRRIISTLIQMIREPDKEYIDTFKKFRREVMKEKYNE